MEVECLMDAREWVADDGAGERAQTFFHVRAQWAHIGYSLWAHKKPNNQRKLLTMKATNKPTKEQYNNNRKKEKTETMIKHEFLVCHKSFAYVMAGYALSVSVSISIAIVMLFILEH